MFRLFSSALVGFFLCLPFGFFLRLSFGFFLCSSFGFFPEQTVPSPRLGSNSVRPQCVNQHFLCQFQPSERPFEHEQKIALYRNLGIRDRAVEVGGWLCTLRTVVPLMVRGYNFLYHGR